MADQKTNIKCGFFDSVNNDRKYSADDMNRPYNRVIADGIFATPAGTPSTDLQVLSASNGMNIVVKAGEGLFGGKWFSNETDLTLTVPANNDITPRRDSVIIQVDKRTTGRNVSIVYRTGTPSTNPQVPNLSTSEQLLEMRISNIYVAAGATSINQDAIVDLRGSSECPWITSLIQQVDTSTLYAQWQAAYQKYYEDETTAFNAFMDGLTSQLTVNTNIAIFESNYTSTAETSTVPINIASFDKNRDVLMVFINRLRATPNVDYTISSDSLSITLTTPLNANQSVNFLVMKSLVSADDQTIIAELQQINAKISELNSDSGWANFTLQNGATAYSDGLTPAYRKYDKTVYLRGCIKGISATGTTFATLPDGYRPAMTRYYTLATGTITATIEIGTNGQLKIANVIGTLADSSLIPIDTQFIVG